MFLEPRAAFDAASAADIASDPSRDAARDDGSGLLVEGKGPLRAELEAFVARRFREVYGARLYTYMPHLYGATGADGRLVAAFGLRRADEGGLFLERYLDAPIEDVIRDFTGETSRRHRIAEVGNLAGATPGALRSLIPRLTLLLQSVGIRWVAFTGSSRVCNGFARLGLPLCIVAPATIDRLPAAERECWGTYYAHEPSVMIGDVGTGARIVNGLAANPAELRERMAPLARVGVP